MKITQEKPKFKPIKIILETREEAQAFLDIIDSDASLRGSARQKLVNRISDAFTNMEVVI